jgi:Ser/Thr protein kinase RdoA (MazF antagonist)
MLRGDESGEGGEGDRVAEAFGLGHPARLEGPVAAGRLGDVWRLTTPHGRWAVKETRHTPDPAACERDAAYQDAVRTSGVPMPAVVRSTAGRVLEVVAGTTVRVYEWVDVRPEDRRLDPAAVGVVVAAIHRVRYPADASVDPWYAAPIGPARWTELLGRLGAAGAPFAPALADLLPAQLEVEALVTEPRRLQMCHLDLWADNLRAGAGPAAGPGSLVVLDWENCGAGDVSRELAGVLFEYGCGDPARIRALDEAYRAAGGPGRVRTMEDFGTLVAQLAHIAVTGCERWLAARSDAERADNAAWVSEFVDDPVTVDTLEGILDALS